MFVIEHLDRVGKWLIIEYRHAAKLVGGDKLLITNAESKRLAEALKGLARVDRRRVWEIFDQEKLIVLDPQAEHRLSPRDFEDAEAVVVGGILGDHPPRGRTRLLLTEKMPAAKARKLFDAQLPIDAAIYVAYQVYLGKPLEEIPLCQEVEIRHDEVHSTVLPFAYPLVGGVPLISEELVEHVRRTALRR